MAMLGTIAAIERDDVTETVDRLDASLNSYVDLDALDTVVRSEDTDSIPLEAETYHGQSTGNTVSGTDVER